jgi:thiol-disulfide isomerase/thioredoxin
LRVPAFLKKQGGNIIWIGVFVVVLFVPGAKALLLKGLIKTGIFNAGTERQASGQILPDLAFTNDHGEVLHTTALKGKVVFINFWATWCPPCIAEMGSINAMKQSMQGDPNFVCIMVDADANLPAANAFIEKRGYSLPVYRTAAVIPDSLFSGTLPTTLIIDREGKLASMHSGIANYDTEAMRDFLKGL